MDGLQAGVAATGSVGASAVKLLEGLKAKLDDWRDAVVEIGPAIEAIEEAMRPPVIEAERLAEVFTAEALVAQQRRYKEYPYLLVDGASEWRIRVRRYLRLDGSLIGWVSERNTVIYDEAEAGVTWVVFPDEEGLIERGEMQVSVPTPAATPPDPSPLPSELAAAKPAKRKRVRKRKPMRGRRLSKEITRLLEDDFYESPSFDTIEVVGQVRVESYTFVRDRESRAVLTKLVLRPNEGGDPIVLMHAWDERTGIPVEMAESDVAWPSVEQPKKTIAIARVARRVTFER